MFLRLCILSVKINFILFAMRQKILLLFVILFFYIIHYNEVRPGQYLFYCLPIHLSPCLLMWFHILRLSQSSTLTSRTLSTPQSLLKQVVYWFLFRLLTYNHSAFKRFINCCLRILEIEIPAGFLTDVTLASDNLNYIVRVGSFKIYSQLMSAI